MTERAGYVTFGASPLRRLARERLAGPTCSRLARRPQCSSPATSRPSRTRRPLRRSRCVDERSPRPSSRSTPSTRSSLLPPFLSPAPPATALPRLPPLQHQVQQGVPPLSPARPHDELPQGLAARAARACRGGRAQDGQVRPLSCLVLSSRCSSRPGGALGAAVALLEKARADAIDLVQRKDVRALVDRVVVEWTLSVHRSSVAVER